MKEKVLQHERNKNIEFDEAEHTYTYKGDTQYQGVTSLIGKYCKPFNAKKIAKKLVSYHPEYKHLTVQGVLDKWNDSRLYGNEIDRQLEDWVNKGLDSGTKELKNIKKALESQNLTPICAQWVIYNENIERASAVDLVCVNENDDLVIIDLKTMKKPIKKKAYKDKKMSYPLNSLPDSKYYKQSLQIGMYADWIEKYYHFPVSITNYIMRIRPDLWEMIPVLNVEKEIDDLINFEK